MTIGSIRALIEYSIDKLIDKSPDLGTTERSSGLHFVLRVPHPVCPSVKVQIINIKDT
jgi:hypothetical protein